MVFHCLYLCFLSILSMIELHIRHWCFVMENPSLTTSHYFFQKIMVLVQYPEKLLQCILCFLIDILVSLWHQPHIQKSGHNKSHYSHTSIQFFSVFWKVNWLCLFQPPMAQCDHFLKIINGYIYYHVQCLPFHIQTS